MLTPIPMFVVSLFDSSAEGKAPCAGKTPETRKWIRLSRTGEGGQVEPPGPTEPLEEAAGVGDEDDCALVGVEGAPELPHRPGGEGGCRPRAGGGGFPPGGEQREHGARGAPPGGG